MRVRIRYTLIGLGACTAIGGFAQSLTVDTVSERQPWAPFARYTFPHVAFEGHADIAERIDRDLTVDLLELDPDTTEGSIFQRVWGSAGGDPLPRWNALTWSCSMPYPQVVSFVFSGEACGAYCEGATIHRSYDLRDGHRLVYGDLFTTEGLAMVNERVHKRWVDIVETRIDQLEDSLRNAVGPPGTSESVEASLALYRACLIERPVDRPYVADMEPLPGTLRVWIARCSAHADRGLDDLGEVAIDIPAAELAPYWAPGLAALLGR